MLRSALEERVDFHDSQRRRFGFSSNLTPMACYVQQQLYLLYSAKNSSVLSRELVQIAADANKMRVLFAYCGERFLGCALNYGAKDPPPSCSKAAFWSSS